MPLSKVTGGTGFGVLTNQPKVQVNPANLFYLRR